MIPAILFLTLSNVNIQFAEREFVWRIYIAAETLSMIKKMEIIDKREFAVATLNSDDEIIVVYLAFLVKPITILIYSSCQAQVALLTSEEKGIFAEYFDFSNVFSSDAAAKLPKYNRINDYPINLVNDKQLLYGLIYSLGAVKLETLKIYIEANLASNFMRPYKSSASALILFVQKKDDSLHLCIDYQGLNNLIIKNCYLLPMTGK